MDMPQYAQDAISGEGQGSNWWSPMAFSPQGRWGAATLLGGLFGNSGAPYGDAMDQYKQWANKAEGVQNPFLQAGYGALGPYQQMLGNMSHPTDFINHIMGQYQQSPLAKFQQQQGMRAAQNMGSASGLSGSTPLMNAAQQNAQNISSQDQNQWLQNILGVNNNAMAGYGNLISGGQNAANSLSNLYGQEAGDMSQLAYNQGRGNQNDMWNMISGGAALAGLF